MSWTSLANRTACQIIAIEANRSGMFRLQNIGAGLLVKTHFDMALGSAVVVFVAILAWWFTGPEGVVNLLLVCVFRLLILHLWYQQSGWAKLAAILLLLARPRETTAAIKALRAREIGRVL
jgi:hypothetical protein